MIIDNNLPSVNHGRFALSKQKGTPGVAEIKVSIEHLSRKPDLKEIAAELISEPPQMGEFKDKKGVEQRTDLTIGPDIQYALTSKNVAFLKRLLRGLTVGEYREVQYRIKELQKQSVSSPNMLSGQVIDTDQLHKANYKSEVDTMNVNDKTQPIDVKV